jgi:hypothetical protein
VLHTWGSALTHHPHVHMIVPGGGLSLDNARWVASRSNFLVHVGLRLMAIHRGWHLPIAKWHERSSSQKPCSVRYQKLKRCAAEATRREGLGIATLRTVAYSV